MSTSLAPNAGTPVPALPWWRHGFVWLVFGLPASAVVAASASGYIAIRGADPVVPEYTSAAKQAAEESLSRTRLSPSGRLRVDAPTGLASDVIVPALPDFFIRYPDIQLELGCSDRPVDLIEVMTASHPLPGRGSIAVARP